MVSFGIFRQVWTWLRFGQASEIEDTTTPDVSQETVSESNQQSSPGSTADRSSDPTRSKQTSLCNICAHGLSLDDSRAGGALEEPRNDGTPNLCFPWVGEREKDGWFCGVGDLFTWKGGAQYEQRDITPPHLPELPDECIFCHTVKNALLNQLGRHEWWDTTTTKLRYLVQYEWSGSRKKGCQLLFKLNSLKVEAKHPELGHPCSINFPIATSSCSCQEWLHITGRPVDVESPLSKRNVDLILSWLEQCNTDPSCRRSAKTKKFLPTRLLDVGSKGSKNPYITLVKTQCMAQLEASDGSPEYTCLSYMWGAAEPPLKTTNDTIEDYRTGIPMDSMPRVFRDAVLVTRTLGIRYLWIDALCIIQGCDEDWHNESAAMADVFSHSWMTIGAATASSCHDTLFYPRQNLSIDIEFQSSIKRNVIGTISILLLSQYFGFPLRAGLKNSTWDTRGWVWQEQKLSQRLLIFGERMLHFRCHRRMLHEYGRHYASNSEDSHVSLNGPNEWTSVIHLYSRRKLSNGRDRLAAISGFVKAVAQELQDTGKSATYVAGIWLAEKAEVDRQLFWFLQNPTISFGQLLRYHKDPKQYIAPSWSWAALNQPVDTLINGTRPVFKVVTHNIKPARSDAIVAIAPGSSITFLGKLRKIPGRLSKAIKSSYTWNTKTWWWEAPYSGDEDAWRRRNAREQNVARNIKYFLDWDPSTHDPDEGDIEAHLELFLLTTCSQGYGRSAIGLILCPDAVDSKLFLRVGCFEIYGPWESSDWKETEVVII